jgi:protein-S-isoprenylcysteine O-methyltransferase Ste14
MRGYLIAAVLLSVVSLVYFAASIQAMVEKNSGMWAFTTMGFLLFMIFGLLAANRYDDLKHKNK